MGKKKNIIEINGNRYDAHTGAAINHVPITVKPAPSKTITVHHHSAPTYHAHQAASRQPAKRLSHHATQRSKTLMRQAVKKPSPSLKRRLKAQGHTGNLAKQPAAAVVPKLSFGNLSPQRLQHASYVKKSSLVSHFNLNASDSQSIYKVPVTIIKSKPTPKLTMPPKRQPAPDATDIFDRAIQQATSHLEPAPKAHRRRLHLTRKHAKHVRA